MPDCNDFRNFKGITNVGNDTLTTILENNLKEYYDWAFLGIGAWTDVNIPTSGIYGGDYSVLRLVSDPQYTDGQVWESVRKDWVWDTGVEWTGSNEPISVSGVTIDDTFYALGDATYGHHINYPLGRIVFDSAITTTSTVKANYSYRDIQVYVADNAEWFREIQYRSLRPDADHVSQADSGDFSIMAQHRVQLPAIIIECAARGSARPYELGSGSLIKEQDVLFHVIAETRNDRNKLIDIISLQTDRTIWLFDTNAVGDDSAYPLDYRGMLTGSNMYPDFVNEGSSYRWRKCYLRDAVISEVESLNPYLYQGLVRTTAEVILG